MNRRVTARKYLGDDRASWAVFLDGRPVVTGLTRREVPYYRRRVEEDLANVQSFGGAREGRTP